MRTKLIFYAFGFLSFIFTAFPLQVSAQQDRSSDRIKSIKVAYITEQLNLSPKEAEVFWPVYNDFESRKGEINHAKRESAEQFLKNQENLSDPEILQILDKHIKYHKEETELFVQFDKKFREILPPGKVMKLYIADVQFRNYLIKKFREQHGHPEGEQE